MSARDRGSENKDTTYEPAYGPPLPLDRFDIAFRDGNAKACDKLLRRLERFHPRPH